MSHKPKPLKPTEGLYIIQDSIEKKYDTKFVQVKLDIATVYKELVRNRKPFFNHIISEIDNYKNNYNKVVLLFCVLYDIPGQPNIRHSVCIMFDTFKRELDIFDPNGIEIDPATWQSWTFKLSEILIHIKHELQIRYSIPNNKTIIYNRLVNIDSVCDNWVHFYLCRRIRDKCTQCDIDCILGNYAGLSAPDITNIACEITFDIVNKTI